MGFLIGILTFVMVVDCLALILLVLIQLPKKEAGAGLAFGGAATDALFGAGSGNVLTKITKYAAGIFFVLAILLSVFQSYHYRSGSTKFREAIEQAGTPRPSGMPPSQGPRPQAPPAVAPPTGTNLLAVTPPVESTTVPAAPATNVTPLASPSGTNK
jgi:preprotein translocase subunit SecG